MNKVEIKNFVVFILLIIMFEILGYAMMHTYNWA